MNDRPAETMTYQAKTYAADANEPESEVWKTPTSIPVERPPFRRLNAYAFDPSLSQQLQYAGINRVTLKVPWEFDPETNKDTLEPGPVGEYLEVVDVDPASRCFYAPVNLDEPYLLATDGLTPAEANPQFHQQMVYAVAMTTIMQFEHALGRRILWSPHRAGGDDYEPDRSRARQPNQYWTYVPQLRIYPHALREANAYYSSEKKALLFGYFPAFVTDVGEHLPGGMVFTCLSHDVIAHETTHALLDGMHRRFLEASNRDILAFHEAFADIVALFQHFSFPEVLRQQIARTRGDLATENLLAQLAQQFGQATGLHGALRDSLGTFNKVTNKWEATPPDPKKIQCEDEPHARGAILVAAVFRAFVSIYKARSVDLLRIATSGTGILPEGELHPDLVNRLAAEAAKAAQHVLRMCIRALDYCPPVDLTFGEYLRAMITADYDLVRDDDLGYRLAVVEAFRDYGIYPREVRTLSVDSLRWQPPVPFEEKTLALPCIEELRALVEKQGYTTNRERIYYEQNEAAKVLHQSLQRNPGLAAALGLDTQNVLWPDGTFRFEVHSCRPAHRVGPDGQTLIDLVVEMTQWRPGYDNEEVQKQAATDPAKVPEYDFRFRGGSTLLIDLHSGTVRYVIFKDVMSSRRLSMQRDYRAGKDDATMRGVYFSGLEQARHEPLAFLHRSEPDGGPA
jgi:hypothetical protein